MQEGVLYPRASTLGGCTAHHAMIFMRPPDSGWNAIADETGDPSWRAVAMQAYFQKIDNCRYRCFWRFINKLSAGRINPTGHGFGGWLSVEWPMPIGAIRDHLLIKIIRNAARGDLFGDSRSVVGRLIHGAARLIEGCIGIVLGEGDPNDIRLDGDKGIGLTKTPLSTENGRRRGARERVQRVIASGKYALKVEYDALATRVIFEDKRATGVEYLKGRNLYRACPEPSSAPGERREAKARREIVLCAGAFNTPQLLMLSGVGPAEVLGANGIEPVSVLEGVGQNLQDRYEISAIHRTTKPWSCLAGVEFSTDDQMFAEWRRGRGMYCSNGAAVAFIGRSSSAREAPDLFGMALLTRFRGYFPGYSKDIRASHSDLSFALLKAHTLNHGGFVTLRSPDPRDPPLIDFRGFEEGTDTDGKDLAAVIEGVAHLRNMMKAGIGGELESEDTPGPHLTGDVSVAQFIRDYAWGHHASCTCKIGAGPNSVLTGDFRVRGTKGLRVVDASIFPSIPGFFIVCAIYMVAEKAAAVILDAASARA
jgi:choline dehydrogenase-like flavoprotein